MVLKPRHRIGEDTYHRMRHHPETLLAGTELPANFSIDYTPIGEQLPTVDLLITVSSTACLEALDHGSRVALVLDLGLHERYGNHVFLDSGLLRTCAADRSPTTSAIPSRTGWPASSSPTRRRERAPVTRPRRSWIGSRSCWPPASGRPSRLGRGILPEHRPGPADLPRRAYRRHPGQPGPAHPRNRIPRRSRTASPRHQPPAPGRAAPGPALVSRLVRALRALVTSKSRPMATFRRSRPGTGNSPWRLSRSHSRMPGWPHDAELAGLLPGQARGLAGRALGGRPRGQGRGARSSPSAAARRRTRSGSSAATGRPPTC